MLHNTEALWKRLIVSFIRQWKHSNYFYLMNYTDTCKYWYILVWVYGFDCPCDLRISLKLETKTKLKLKLQTTPMCLFRNQSRRKTEHKEWMRGFLRRVGGGWCQWHLSIHRSKEKDRKSEHEQRSPLSKPMLLWLMVWYPCEHKELNWKQHLCL